MRLSMIKDEMSESGDSDSKVSFILAAVAVVICLSFVVWVWVLVYDKFAEAQGASHSGNTTKNLVRSLGESNRL